LEIVPKLRKDRRRRRTSYAFPNLGTISKTEKRQ